MTNHSTATAAKALQMSPAKVRRLIELGKLEASNVSLGHSRPRYVITQQAIEDYLASTLLRPKKARRPRRFVVNEAERLV